MAVKRKPIAIDGTVRVSGGVLQIGNRWQLRLPEGWHIHQDDISEGVTYVSFYKGIRQIGHMGIGNTTDNHLQALVQMRLLLNRFLSHAGILVDAVLRNDDRLVVTVQACIQETGLCASFAEIGITEKDHDNLHTVIFVELSSGVSNVKERLDNIRRADREIEHYFGNTWDENWQAVSFMAASVSLIGDVAESVPLGTRQKLGFGFSARFPSGMKRLKGPPGTEADMFYVTDSPSFKDYQSKEKDYVLLYYENEIDSKEKHDFQMIRQFAKYNLQSIESPFSEPVYERQYPDGYVGVFINYLEESTDVSVNATNLRMESIGAALISQNGKKSPAELIAIACEFADNVEINGEKGKPLGSGHPQITDGFGTMPAKTESVKPASKSAPQTKTKAPAKTATIPRPEADIDLSAYIPAGVKLTDRQKEYLSGIIDLINKYGPATDQDISLHLHKPVSQVITVVGSLVKKGVLDYTDGFKVVIAEKNDPAEDKETAATKEVSIYSSKYKEKMRARLLPGETDLPPECSCNYINFRAGDIAENGIRFNLLKDKGPVIENLKYHMKIQGAYLEIPEGVTEIGSYAFAHGEYQIVKLPRSLRTLDQGAFSDCPNLRKIIFQEGIKAIGAVICGNCPNLTELHLPDTVEIIDYKAFTCELSSRQSNIIVYMTEALAKKIYANVIKEDLDPLPYAKSFIINGKAYPDLDNYVKTSERERRAAAERQHQERLRREEENRKNAQRDSLRRRISQLEKERDALKGLFAGIKRKKIQEQIDILNVELRKI